MKKIIYLVMFSVLCLTGCSSNSVDLEEYLTTIFTVPHSEFEDVKDDFDIITDGDVSYYDFGEDVKQAIDDVYGSYVEKEMLEDGNAFYTQIVCLQYLRYTSDFTMDVDSVTLDKIDDNQYDYSVVVDVTNYSTDQITLTGRIQMRDGRICSTTVNGFDLTQVINE